MIKQITNQQTVSKRITWQIFYDEGCQFHRTAKGAVSRPEIFTPAIVQNIAAMAVEKFIMAVLLERRLTPLGHTMTDLCQAAASIMPLTPRLWETLLYMDRLQQICSIEHFQITAPSLEDVPAFLEAADAVADAARKILFT